MWQKITVWYGRRVYAGSETQMWCNDSWRPIPKGAKVEPLADCPWYATPQEATLRARGLSITRYVCECGRPGRPVPFG